MEEKKKPDLKKLIGAGFVIFGAGCAYYVTSWQIKNQIIKPALKTFEEELGVLLESFSEKKEN